MNKKIKNMILVIKECPELFHDGIDEEIIQLLEEINKENEKLKKELNTLKLSEEEWLDKLNPLKEGK